MKFSLYNTKSRKSEKSKSRKVEKVENCQRMSKVLEVPNHATGYLPAGDSFNHEAGNINQKKMRFDDCRRRRTKLEVEGQEDIKKTTFSYSFVE